MKEGKAGMRERDKIKNRKETIHALAMILQIGLAVMVCMGMSLAIGYYIDRLFRTKIWVPVMMIVGILAAIRSMLVLTGHYRPGSSSGDSEEYRKGTRDEDGKDDAD